MSVELDKQGMKLAASSKPLKASSSVSEMVSKFAKVCKFRSVGVFNTSDANLNHGHNHEQIYPDNASSSFAEESNSDATEDAEFDGMKIHPPPTVLQRSGNECGHMEIMTLFDTLLALKLAYIRLQQAHVPYNPENIRAADKEVLSHLDSLGKIKKAYKEKLLKEVDSVSKCSALLVVEIQVQEKALDKLKSQAKNKDKEVMNLLQKYREMEMRNKKLAEAIREQEKESFECLSNYSFEDVVKSARKAIHDFAKPLIALLKVSEWDLDQAANAIQESVVYAKRSHKKYIFEAYIGRRMFQGFSPQPCILENLMKLDDPIDALIADPQSSFAKFCRIKYLLVVHPKMEASFFGNLDHRTFITNGIHPYTPFYRAFIKMVRWVWILLGFTASVEPRSEIFVIKRGSEFLDVYMEVPEELQDEASIDKVQERYKVEFTVMPGFKLGDTLIRSQVYVSKVGFSNGMH